MGSTVCLHGVGEQFQPGRSSLALHYVHCKTEYHCTLHGYILRHLLDNDRKMHLNVVKFPTKSTSNSFQQSCSLSAAKGSAGFKDGFCENIIFAWNEELSSLGGGCYNKIKATASIN